MSIVKLKKWKGEKSMETINLWDFQLDFVKDLLRAYMKSKSSDRDTRLMAQDTLDNILEQYPDKAYEISLLTGELIAIDIT